MMARQGPAPKRDYIGHIYKTRWGGWHVALSATDSDGEHLEYSTAASSLQRARQAAWDLVDRGELGSLVELPVSLHRVVKERRAQPNSYSVYALVTDHDDYKESLDGDD